MAPMPFITPNTQTPLPHKRNALRSSPWSLGSARSRSALPSDHYQRASGAYSPDYKIVHL
jgi:hypothetical protein